MNNIKTIIMECLLFTFFIIAVFTNSVYPGSLWQGKILMSDYVREEPPPRPFSLFIMNADGSNISRIYDMNAIGIPFSLSPDCSKIVFGDAELDSPFKDTIITDIYIMNADGSNKINLTNTVSINEGSPWWSPDGRQIVYAKTNKDGISSICIMDTGGKQLRELRQGLCSGWSSKNQILFLSEGDIFRMNSNGLDLLNLTKGRPAGNPLVARWSPEGNNIAFECNDDIYIMDENGNNLKNITNSKFIEYNPCWSSTGDKIIFGSVREDGDGHIYIMNPDGSDIERLMQVDSDKNKQFVEWGSCSVSDVFIRDKSRATMWGDIKKK